MSEKISAAGCAWSIFSRIGPRSPVAAGLSFIERRIALLWASTFRPSIAGTSKAMMSATIPAALAAARARSSSFCRSHRRCRRAHSLNVDSTSRSSSVIRELAATRSAVGGLFLHSTILSLIAPYSVPTRARLLSCAGCLRGTATTFSRTSQLRHRSSTVGSDGGSVGTRRPGWMLGAPTWRASLP